jgi:membrane protein YqaA with SNARE-associated domain
MSKNEYIEINEEGKFNIDKNEKLILPSEAEKIEKRNKKRKEKIVKRIKFFSILFIIIFLYLSYNKILYFIFELLKQNPTLYTYYLFIKDQIVNNTILGIFILSILGSLFFLALPSEALFIYFIGNTSLNPLLLILIVIFGNLTGLIFNYLFGFILGERIIKFIFSKNYEKYKKLVLSKWGGLILFIGNIFPGPIEVLTVFYGGFRYNIKKYFYLSLVGRTFKYLILFVLYTFYWTDLMNLIHTIKSFFGF